MGNIKQQKEEALAKVNGVMTALDMYPNVELTSTGLSANMSFNPIDMLMDLLKATKGYDWIVEEISKYVVYGIPVLEASVKTILLTNIRTMLSCSLNPLITRDMILNGVTFDISKIDLLNMFSYSPLDKSITSPGRYYYFNEEGITTIDDVQHSRDFNAVLWSAKNTPGRRIVWRRERDLATPYSMQERNIGNIVSWTKQPKSNGIVTIEYDGRSSAITNAEGNQCLTQEPVSNCMHVFIGCTKEVENTESIKQAISNINTILDHYSKFIDTLKDKLSLLNDWERKHRTTILENGGDTANNLNNLDKEITEDRKTIRIAIRALTGIVALVPDSSGKNPGEPGYVETIIKPTTSAALQMITDKNGREPGDDNYIATYRPDTQVVTSIVIRKIGYEDTIIDIPQELLISTKNNKQTEKIGYESQLVENNVRRYATATSNYYFMHPIMEFNTDFVMSMKLYDSKVVTAQLLDAITDCLRVNLNLSVEQKMVQYELREIITNIIETDDSQISDCFFTFDNDTYNSMLQTTEMNRIGLVSDNGIDAYYTTSVERLMAGLNSLNENATKEELLSVIQGSLFEAVSSTNPHVPGTIDYDITANMNIIEKLLTKLTYVLVSIVLSPKVYILLMTNLKLIGETTEFDLQKFIQQFKDMIKDLCRMIRDKIIQYFYDEIVKILKELATELGVQLSLEQYKYYIRLLQHCLDCVKIHGNNWDMDAVDYADIETATAIVNQEC